MLYTIVQPYSSPQKSSLFSIITPDNTAAPGRPVRHNTSYRYVQLNNWMMDHSMIINEYVRFSFWLQLAFTISVLVIYKLLHAVNFQSSHVK